MSLVEKIWNMELEQPCVKNDEEKQLLGEIIKLQDQIYGKLDEEYRSIFEEYNNLQIELCALNEKLSFVRGIKFATQYIFETLA